MKRKIKKRVALFLMIAVTIGFVPQMAAPVYADEDVPVMAMGTKNVLKRYVNTDKAQTVWYGDNSTWRVISYDGEGNQYTNPSGAMTLFASETLEAPTQFDPSSNAYKGSYLQKFVDELHGYLFSEGEKQAIVERELIVDKYTGSGDGCAGVSYEETTGYLWPLSTAEANCLPSDEFRSDVKKQFWWLRSPGNNNENVAVVYDDGSVNKSGFSTLDVCGIRPAFDLNLEAVLFTSKANDFDDGKDSGPLGAYALEGVRSRPEEFTGEWNLTMKDDGTVKDLNGKPITGLSGHKDFQVTEYTATDNNVSVKYTGAKTGGNEYISAIITDKPITEDGPNITYYGRIKNCASDDDASGTVEINTARKLRDTDTLYVFNEQYNGVIETDYASALYEVTPYPPVGRISKAANPLKIKGKTATVKYSKLKKKNQTLAVTKVMSFTNDVKDKKSYALSSAKKGKKSFKKYFKVNKTSGKLTVKKGLKKGTYKVKIKVKAAGNKNYKAVTKAVTVTVKVRE